MEENTKLHFTRARVKGEPDFFDPQTDFRRLLPAVSKMSVMALEDNADDDGIKEDFRYLHNCFHIFCIRILEDPQPIDKQCDAFIAALAKCRKTSVDLWFRTIGTYFLLLYGLFCRRDAASDADSLLAMFEYSRLALYQSALKPATYAAMQEDLRAAGILKPVENKTTDDAVIACSELPEKTIKHCKQLARMYLSASGDTSWEALAAACDKGFSTSGGNSDDMKKIVLGLAYPDYNTPFLSLEVTDDTE